MVVLDACAAFQIASESADGKALFASIEKGESIVVPSHFKVEFINTLSKYVRGGYISEETARLYFNKISDLITMQVKVSNVVTEVLHESVRLKHNAYDIVYFVIARRNGATLLTVDKRLAEICEENRVSAVHFFDL